MIKCTSDKVSLTDSCCFQTDDWNSERIYDIIDLVSAILFKIIQNLISSSFNLGLSSHKNENSVLSYRFD